MDAVRGVLAFIAIVAFAMQVIEVAGWGRYPYRSQIAFAVAAACLYLTF